MKLLIGTIIAIVLAVFLLTRVAFPAEAKGGGGGRGGGGRSSVSSSSKSSGGSTSKSSVGSKSTTGSRPSSTTKTVTSSSPKTVNGKTYSSKGYVVGEGYTPTFKGGYAPPAGSTVYYRDSGGSAWDWFPMYYIMTHDGSSQAVVTQPDGQEKEVEEEGGDGMYFFNWVLVILIGVGIIGLIIWFVNKRSGGDYDY
jgi:hypothetical protein